MAAPELIEGWLERLLVQLPIAYRQLQAGFSGAAVYRLQFAAVLTDSEMAWIRALLIKLAQPIHQPLPLTLCHGDCITDNILRDADDHLVWADWQEVRLGHGTDDLAFFMQRAAMAGAHFDQDALIQIYHSELMQSTQRDIRLEAIRRGVDAADLYSYTLQWPGYLGQASAVQLADMLSNIHHLAERTDGNC